MFFQNTILKKHLALLNDKEVKVAWETYKALFLNQIRQDNIHASKEEQFQEGFLRDLFVKTLGYTINPDPDFNLITEKKNETDSKKVDGAILRDGKVIGVIELKDHKTPNLKQVETQAFGYKNNHKDTRYVIISNFEKLRFYIDNAVEFDEWDLFSLSEEEFRRLYFCLSWGTLSKDLPIKAKTDSISNEDRITQQLYRDYSAFKREVFADILKNNTTDETPKEQKLLLFKKTQKLLDRLLFIFFAEDCELLPPNMILQIIGEWEQLKALDVEIPLYTRIKQYFGYLDAGNDKKNIYAYNGGLFKPDEELDKLIISDELLALHTRKLSEYDYASEVDVNILGHIFENSLSEIEEVSAQINAGEKPSISKRKRDGVFYTPQYITKYIVENTVGKLCAEKKAELGIDEAEYSADKNRQMATKKRLLDKLDTYREWLKQITICDPACGSGAFLNAALQFLMAEHKLLDDMVAKVAGYSIVYPDVENYILENNLYGVDISEESVEIARLALWLRTAKKERKLSSLNNNIKCGNSLISDPEIAGDKAFNWQEEFPQVFAKGGFDVVIGNPPYLSLTQNNTDNKVLDFYKTAYKSIAKSNSKNLFTLFNEKGVSLVKDKGILSYIIPEGFLKTRSYQDSLNEMQAHGSIDLAMYFEDFVFADAVTGSLIFRYIKGKYDLPCSNLFMHRDHEITEIIEEENTVLTKFNSVQAHKLSEICSLFKGMVVGDRKNSVSYDSSQPDTFYLGNCISRYIFKDKFYCNYNQLRIVGGTSKKEKYDVAPRILIRRTGNTLCCVLLQEPALTESTLYSCYPIKAEYDIMYILALLNSALYTYVVQQKMVTNEQAFPQILMTDLENLPIPECSDQQPFIDLSDRMLSLNHDLQSKRARFLSLLQNNLPEVKISSSLETFDTLDFAGFVAELKKQKIKLSLTQQDEWMDFFDKYKSECNALTVTIAETDKEINARVYTLYGLEADEIKMIEE